MKRISTFLLVLLTGSVNANAGDFCAQQNCPKGRKPVKLCFNSRETNQGSFQRDAARVCYGSDKTFVIGTNDEIAKALDKVAQNCQSIDETIFNGHGDDGFQMTGNLNTVSIQDFKKYGCLFNKNASIQYIGCNVGKDCAGDLLLYQTAKSFLPKGGEVEARTEESMSLIVGLTPSLSANLTNRKIVYNPEDALADKWKFTGLGYFREEKDVNLRCVEKIDQMTKKYELFKKNSEKGNCARPYAHMTPKRMEGIQKLATQMRSEPRFLQNANPEIFHDVFDGLLSMKTDITNYSRCWNQRPGATIDTFVTR